jgi:hypothetical protein
MGVCMSQFISLRILASLGLGRSKVAHRETPKAPAVAERTGDPGARAREEPSSTSRLRVDRVRIEA